LSASETITHTDIIYEGRTVTLKLHQVRLEDGRESKREIVEHRGAVALVALTEDGRVYMVRQFRLSAGEVLLELPAGTIDPGETPLATAAREIEEEIGMKAGSLEELASFFVSPGFCTEKITVYLATDLTPSSQNLDEDEVMEVVKLSMEEALEKCTDGSIQDAKTLIGLMTATRRLKVPGKLNEKT
jgi:ADP-ribose pyrophosphatase